MADIDFFKQNSKNSNTTKATNTWYTRYTNWAKDTSSPQNLESLEPVLLNNVLERFFAEVEKEKGGNYEPSSLGAMQAGLQRYLDEHGYLLSILKDKQFQGSRDVVEGKARYLRSEYGLGRKPNRAKTLNLGEEEALWENEKLGGSNARSLTNTMWWVMTQHFGLRGHQEHHTMRVEDFVIRTDDANNEYLTFAEGATKTRQGGTRKKERLVQPKMFATGCERCPINFFKQFLARRPQELRESGPFYLAIIVNPATEVWYKNSRMGANTINTIMKTMVAQTPALSSNTKKLTNHSGRKTLVSKMKKAGIPKSEIIGVTGHNAESGLDPYDSGDEIQQRAYSHIIDRHEPSTSGASSSEPSTSGASSSEPSFSLATPVPSSSVTSAEKSLVTRYDKFSLPKKNFNFFSDKEYEKFNGNTVMNFYNCEVVIGDKRDQPIEKRRKRVCFIHSSDSSQET